MPTDTAFSVSCFWKMKKRMMGGIIEKTTERIIVSALTVCSVLNTNRRTITVCSALPRSTRYGRRKSDHAALMAKIAITEQIGLDSGRTM